MDNSSNSIEPGSTSQVETDMHNGTVNIYGSRFFMDRYALMRFIKHSDDDTSVADDSILPSLPRKAKLSLDIQSLLKFATDPLMYGRFAKLPLDLLTLDGATPIGFIQDGSKIAIVYVDSIMFSVDSQGNSQSSTESDGKAVVRLNSTKLTLDISNLIKFSSTPHEGASTSTVEQGSRIETNLLKLGKLALEKVDPPGCGLCNDVKHIAIFSFDSTMPYLDITDSTNFAKPDEIKDPHAIATITWTLIALNIDELIDLENIFPRSFPPVNNVRLPVGEIQDAIPMIPLDEEQNIIEDDDESVEGDGEDLLAAEERSNADILENDEFGEGIDEFGINDLSEDEAIEDEFEEELEEDHFQRQVEELRYLEEAHRNKFLRRR